MSFQININVTGRLTPDEVRALNGVIVALGGGPAIVSKPETQLVGKGTNEGKPVVVEPATVDLVASFEAPGNSAPISKDAEKSLAEIFGAGPLAESAPAVAGAAPSQTAPEAAPVTSTSTIAVPNVPSSPAAAAPPIPADRDKDGVVWDERIHAGTKGKNKDGTWKRRRNVPDLEYTQIVQELAAIDAANKLSAPPAPPAPPAPLAASGAPPVPGLPPASGLTFGIVVKHAQDAIAAGHMGQPDIGEMLAPFGVPSLGALASRPDVWAQFDAAVQAKGAAHA